MPQMNYNSVRAACLLLKSKAAQRLGVEMKRLWGIAVVISPAILILILMLMISVVTGHPQDLFFTRSIRGIPVRFVMVTLTLVAPISILPSFLALAGNKVKGERALKYRFAMMDDETRFWIAQEVADSKQEYDARRLF